MPLETTVQNAGEDRWSYARDGKQEDMTLSP